METQQQDFYQKIRKQIANYLEKKEFQYADILMLAPDFFHLLVKLSIDERVSKESKLKLIAGIAYFISPIDFLPEAILGPIGYMDDIAISAYILNEFINKNNAELVYEHWAGKGDILASIQNVLTIANNYIGEGLWEKIKNRFH
jgi:uncharacterized membrane protein YkvA (DUF1232 family)